MFRLLWSADPYHHATGPLADTTRTMSTLSQDFRIATPDHLGSSHSVNRVRRAPGHWNQLPAIIERRLKAT